MADIYTPPPEHTYLLNVGFWMPSHNGDRWAVSFSNNGATIMAAALSVIVTFSFLCLWNLITVLAMFLDGKQTRRRYVALVTLWNSNDPWFAFKALLHYSIQCMRDPAASRDDLWYGFGFCFVAFSAFAGALAMGIVAPSLVQIGNVAPVRSSTVFYPATPSANSSVEVLQEFGLRAPAVMRSLGSVEAAKVTLRSKVLIDYDDDYSQAPNGGSVASLGYTYNLTGVEMGLQKASGLALDVEGFCFTEYGWAVNASGDAADKADGYRLWDMTDRDHLIPVFLSESDISGAPMAAFYVHPDFDDQITGDANVSYAVVIHSAHRASITESDDPWYVTEGRPDNLTAAPFDAKFWMKRGRPVLSCWEQTRWWYGKHTVNSVYDLKDIPGMKINEVILDVLEAALGTSPMVARIGNASGDSALRSRTTSPNGVIDARASSMEDDLERLILAAFVATRSIFTDATMFGIDDDFYRSIFTGPDKQPRDGSGNFVVSSPDIQTFSLTGIVTLVVILGFLLLANTVAWGCLRFFHHSSAARAKNTNASRGISNTEQSPVIANQENSSDKKAPTDGDPSNAEEAQDDILKDKWTRFRVLAAAQLFRCLYEVDGKEANWSCEKGVPRGGDNTEFQLLRCKNGSDENSSSSKDKCMGHIKRDTAPRTQNHRESKVDAAADDDGKGVRDSVNPVGLPSP